ncbi:MAG: small multi-drug export protein [Lentisphaeria bacterium]|nr:small multi-drug export protein [Lentisphaeria bacterium]
MDIFLLGFFCALALLAWSGYLQFQFPVKGARMLAIISTHLMLGRAAGISAATVSHHFSRLETILLGSLVEGAVVCLFFSAFCLSCKKLIHVPWLDSAVRNVRDSAHKQRHLLAGWGIPGLILFVWFPFLMTGPVVGSVIGYLLGMRPWTVIAAVMAGTISAIVSWTFLMGVLDHWMKKAGHYAPAAAVLTILAVLVTIRIHSYHMTRKKERENGVARELPDDTADGGPEPAAVPGSHQDAP